MYQHVLLATDLLDSTLIAAKKAQKIVEQFHSTFSIVHVIEPIMNYGYTTVTDFESAQTEECRKELAELANKIGVPGVQQYIKHGSIKYEVLKLAKDIKCDLIVVGSHGRHGLALLLGSSANAIVHGSHCDVLVVRATD